MTEELFPPGVPSGAQQLSAYGKLLMLWAEAEEQALHPPSGDPVIGAMWRAVPEVVGQSRALGELITAWVARQDIKQSSLDPQGKPISQVAGELRTHFQLDRLRRSRGFRGHEDPLVWRRGLLAMTRSPQRLADFQVSQGLPLNTTNGERYGPPEVVRQLMYSGTEPVDMADGGSSIMIGVNQIALKARYPFALPRLIRPSGVDAAGNTVWGADDPDTQTAYHFLLNAPPVPGRFTSFDLFHPRDPAIRTIARAALRPTSEISNRRFMHRFHALAGQKPELADTVDFMLGDVLSVANMRAIREQFPDRKFRIAFLGTVVNQLGEENIPRAVEASMELLDDREDAMVLILDFVHPDANDPSVVRLHPRWDSGTYALMGIYKKDPERRARVFFRFQTSRPSEVSVGPDQIMVDGAFMGVREALLRRRRLLAGA